MAEGLIGGDGNARRIRGGEPMSLSRSVDPTVTAGVIGFGSAGAATHRFFRIPVERVVSDCWSTPDTVLIDILKQHRR